MMKKALLYAVTAVLLGTVTMIAPLMLLKPSYYKARIEGSSEFLEALDNGEGTFEKGGAFERAVSPSNLSSAALIFIPSFLIALGVALYLKKRIHTRILG
jgi:hypothetical protein